MTLYELDQQIRYFFDTLPVDEDGCIDEDALKGFEALQEERKAKLEGLALYYKELTAEAQAIKAEADKLAKRAKATKNKAERIKEYLSMSMLSNGDKGVETTRCKVTFKPSTQVIVTDLDALDGRFIRVTESKDPDKNAIKDAIKKGEVVTGAYLEDKQNIQIN